MMKTIVNILLLLLIVALAYLLYDNIREPIAFQAEKSKRENAVIAKLQDIRTAQELFRSITGNFASDFDTLGDVLTNGRFMIINVMGDPDDPNATFTYDTSYVPARDSIVSLGFNMDSLRYVPYGGKTVFEIAADTMTYQKTLVNVVEVGIPRKAFMGQFGDIK